MLEIVNFEKFTGARSQYFAKYKHQIADGVYIPCMSGTMIASGSYERKDVIGNEAMTRGLRIHGFIDSKLKGEELPMVSEEEAYTANEMLAIAFDELYLDDKKITIEQPYIVTLSIDGEAFCYKMMPDLIVRLSDDHIVIVDWKTGATQKSKVKASHKRQIEAYSLPLFSFFKTIEYMVVHEGKFWRDRINFDDAVDVVEKYFKNMPITP